MWIRPAINNASLATAASARTDLRAPYGWGVTFTMALMGNRLTTCATRAVAVVHRGSVVKPHGTWIGQRTRHDRRSMSCRWFGHWAGNYANHLESPMGPLGMPV